MKNEPFVIIPQSLLRANVSPTTLRVYTFLRSHLNRQTGRCDPRQKSLATELGVTRWTVCRAISRLRAGGFLSAERSQTGCAYTFPARSEVARTSNSQLRARATPSCAHEQLEAVASINEPDVLNQKSATAAAAKGRSSLRESGRATAAAAGSADAIKPNTNTNAAVVVAATKLVDDLIREHPEPGRPDAAVAEAQKALAAAPDVQEACATARRSHAAWRAHWAVLDPHRFIPQLARWFASGEWRYPPAGRKGCQRETWSARQKRESEEWSQNYFRSMAEREDWEGLRENGQDPEVWRAKVQVA